jgi:hypothetical protein
LAKLLRQHLRRVSPRLSSAAVICDKNVSYKIGLTQDAPPQVIVWTTWDEWENRMIRLIGLWLVGCALFVTPVAADEDVYDGPTAIGQQLNMSGLLLGETIVCEFPRLLDDIVAILFERNPARFFKAQNVPVNGAEQTFIAFEFDDSGFRLAFEAELRATLRAVGFELPWREGVVAGHVLLS